jgi:hypothetical protein
MRRPSGDQRGDPCHRPGPWVSWCGSDPSTLASQISTASPERAKSAEAGQQGQRRYQPAARTTGSGGGCGRSGGRRSDRDAISPRRIGTLEARHEPIASLRHGLDEPRGVRPNRRARFGAASPPHSARARSRRTCRSARAADAARHASRVRRVVRGVRSGSGGLVGQVQANAGRAQLAGTQIQLEDAEADDVSHRGIEQGGLRFVNRCRDATTTRASGSAIGVAALCAGASRNQPSASLLTHSLTRVR